MYGLFHRIFSVTFCLKIELIFGLQCHHSHEERYQVGLSVSHVLGRIVKRSEDAFSTFVKFAGLFLVYHPMNTIRFIL